MLVLITMLCNQCNIHQICYSFHTLIRRDAMLAVEIIALLMTGVSATECLSCM